MELTLIQFLTGLFSLILAVVSIYVGLYIASRYRKHNNKILLYLGLAWCGLFNGWWPSAISFILILTTGNPLPMILYFIIGNTTVPWFLFLFITAVTELLYKEKQKIILLFFFIYAVAFDVVLYYYMFTDPSKIGYLQGPVDVRYAGLFSLLLVGVLIFATIGGVLFALESLKSDEPESKLRGKFILYSFLVWGFGSIMDAIIELTVITLPIIRILLISSTVAVYFGILMPDYIKKIFLKSE